MVDVEDSAPVQATEHAAGGVRGALTKRFGPLPVWGWAIAAAGGLYVAYRLSVTHAGTSASVSGSPVTPGQRPSGAGGGVTGGTPSTSGTADTLGAGSVAAAAPATGFDMGALIQAIKDAVKPPTSAAPNVIPTPAQNSPSNPPAPLGTTVMVPQRPGSKTDQATYWLNGAQIAGTDVWRGLSVPAGVEVRGGEGNASLSQSSDRSDAPYANVVAEFNRG